LQNYYLNVPQVARYLLNAGCDMFAVGVGLWENFSSFGAAIVHMPQISLDALQSKASFRKDARTRTVEWE
jgi:hypothetical protein